ncbi:copper resistance CopC family protein [Motilibacter peucedani]|uniref:copper resistance CopC family protein n=1 Tax=Motilibacter peucedani TaxID=598650 RepID=UPI000EB2B16C|nr:copper resistance CopC family protein [Motilibacter peucedani]
MRIDGRTGAVPRALAAAGAVVVAALGWLLLVVAPASAHDHLLSMTPAAGARVGEVPAEVSLTFDAAVGSLGSSIAVTDPSGTRIDARVPEVTDRTIGVSLSVPSTPLKGTYTVDYRIVSADGHVVSDHEAFEVTTGAAAPPATAAPAAAAAKTSSFLGVHAGHVVLVGAVAALALAYLGFDLLRRRAG